MKKNDLLDVLGVAIKAVPSKPVMPIFGTVLLRLKDNRLTLNTTNLELSIEVETAVEGDKLDIAVPAKTLFEIVTNLTDDEVQLNQLGDTLKIACGKYKGSINGLRSEDFPLKDLSCDMVDVDVIGFREQAQSVTYASSTNEMLPTSGILITSDEKSMTMVSTDGFRLAIAKETYDMPLPTASAIIPNNNLREVSRIIGVVKAKSIKVSVGKSILFVIEGEKCSVKIESLVIDGNFPQYEAIIPKDHATDVIVKKTDIVNACKQAKVIAKEGNNFVKVSVYADRLCLSSSSERVGNIETSVAAETNGQLDIGMNIDFLMDALGCINSEKIIIEFDGSAKPIIIYGDDLTKDTIHILMPMRIM